MSNNIAVKVDHVSKYFKLPTEASQSLRTTLVNRFKGIKGYTEQHVLKRYLLLKLKRVISMELLDVMVLVSQRF